MKTCWTLLKKDFLRFWPLLLVWILILSAWAAPACAERIQEHPYQRLLDGLLTGGPLVFAALLIMADGPARRRLDVHARPVPRAAFLLAKGLAMLLLIVLPMVVAHGVVFSANKVSPVLAWQALGEIVLLIMGRCFLAGSMAALCAGITGWIRGAFVLFVAMVLTNFSLHGNNGPFAFLIAGILIIPPDLRHLVFMGILALIFLAWPRFCWRRGWTSDWVHWAGAIAIPCFLVVIFEMTGTNAEPARPPRWNETRPWQAADPALAEKTVKEAILKASTGHRQVGEEPTWIHSVNLSCERRQLPPGLLIDWFCTEDPRCSGALAKENWGRKYKGYTFGSFDSGSMPAIASLLGKNFDSTREGILPDFVEGTVLGVFPWGRKEVAQGEFSLSVRLTGRVWRVRVVKEVAQNESVAWKDETGAWEVIYSDPFPDNVIVNQKRLLLANPSVAEQSANGSSCWYFIEKDYQTKKIESLLVNSEIHSSGWWEINKRQLLWSGNHRGSGGALLILKMEYLGEAVREWNTGPLRFDDNGKPARNFGWPRNAGLPFADYLADLQKNRPDIAACGERDVQRFLWKACRGVGFAGIVGGDDLEKTGQQLAPFAGKFRETFRQGLSDGPCIQNTLLLTALRQGLPEAEFQAMNLPNP